MLFSVSILKCTWDLFSIRHGEASPSGDDCHERRSFDSQFPRNRRPAPPHWVTWGSTQIGQEEGKLRGKHGQNLGFPGGSDGKESRPGFDPWVGKIPCRWEWLPTPVFLPGESHGQKNLEGYGPWGCKDLATTEWLTLSLFMGKTYGVIFMRQGEQTDQVWCWLIWIILVDSGL